MYDIFVADQKQVFKVDHSYLYYMVYEYDIYIACAPFHKGGARFQKLTKRGFYENFPGERMGVAVKRGVKKLSQ